MTIREAYFRASRKLVGNRIVGCREFDSIFVFSIEPVGKRRGRFMDSSISVDKKTGVIKAFQPFDISIDELRRGHEVSLKDIVNTEDKRYE